MPFAPAHLAARPQARLLNDHRDAETAEALGDLPHWDFSGLYAEPAEAAIDQDFTTAEAAAKAFAADYETKVATLDGAALAEAIARYEAIEQRLGRIMSYLGLRYSQNTTDPERAKAMGDAHARATDATAPLVFFTLELNQIDDDALAEKRAASEALARYKPWLDRLRQFRPHQLSDELEKFLHDQSPVGAASWVRLFDETIADLKFEVADPDGETKSLSIEEARNLLTDRNRDLRQAAATAMVETFSKNIRLFALITNTLAKEKEIEDRWRNYPSPQAARHLSNDVEPEVVQALRDAVVAAYPRLSHRYYAMKARWLGLDVLEHWDRNAPLPDEDDRKIPWTDARDTVLSAYAEFSPAMADLAQPFFDKGWIDAPVTPGKAPGAFAHPTVADAHPFVLLNYLGKTRDVMTLAHELGHGVHQRLAAGQGELLSRTPLTLAETASVFGEMLTFKRILGAETNPKKRKALLAGKVEDMINTVVRQIAFYDFECRVHAARREGELTADQLGEIWMSVQGDSLGPAIRFAPGYETFWAHIPHFIHSPFYVYAYAFGDGLVNALYAEYEAAGPEAGFQDKYFDMLRAGGTLGHKALLAPFGLDATDPAFWDKGLGVISGMIDELEALEG